MALSQMILAPSIKAQIVADVIAADQNINIQNTKQLDNNQGQISSAEEVIISAQNMNNGQGIFLAENLLNINANNLTGNGKSDALRVFRWHSG